jgi:hypothetical protein
MDCWDRVCDRHGSSARLLSVRRRSISQRSPKERRKKNENRRENENRGKKTQNDTPKERKTAWPEGCGMHARRKVLMKRIILVKILPIDSNSDGNVDFDEFYQQSVTSTYKNTIRQATPADITTQGQETLGAIPMTQGGSKEPKSMALRSYRTT